jgi:hypothetical protein
VHPDRKTVEVYAKRLWGESLQQSVAFDAITDIGVKRSWGSSEDGGLDYKAFFRDRYGKMYFMMSGMCLSEGEAERMVGSLRYALGRS